MPNGGPKGVQNEVQTRGSPKNKQNVVSYTICYVLAMSTMFKNTYFGDCFGSLEWGPQRGQQKNASKHTLEGAYGHLGVPKHDFGAPRGVPFGGKILQNGILEDVPCSLECQGGPEMAPRGPKDPKLT